MRTVRLNITLPADLVRELEEVAGSRKRSQFIANTLRQRIEEIRQAELETILEEGYRARAKEALAMVKEFEPADLEGWDEY
jgi:metal-responsive CopG/Arc/MetJ family transcriptional regulator